MVLVHGRYVNFYLIDKKISPLPLVHLSGASVLLPEGDIVLSKVVSTYNGKYSYVIEYQDP
jgi:hypothetical protein